MLEHLRQKLIELNIFEENEYFQKYVELITQNITLTYIKGTTQRHHIIPKSYFKSVNRPIDNSKENVVNLYYQDHIKAHCYLSLCSKDPDFKLKNNFAVYKLTHAYHIDHSDLSNSDYELIQQLYEINKQLRYENQPMHDHEIKEKHKQRMQSVEVRQKISETMKKIREQSKNYIYIHKDKESKRIPPEQLPEYLNCGWCEGTRKGRVRIYKDGHENTVWPEELDSYLLAGWQKGGLPGRITAAQRKALDDSHKDRFKSEESRQLQSQKLKDFYKNNPNWKSKSKQAVKIYNEENVLYLFNTVREAELFIGLSPKAIGTGRLSKSFKAGRIQIKSSKYYNWFIEKIESEVMSGEKFAH